MTSFITNLLLKALSFLAVPFFLYLKGKEDGNNRENEERLDLVREVNINRSNLISDSNIAKWVREKYTRK